MTRDEERQFIEQWRRAGAALDAIHREELRQFSHARNFQAVDDLLAAGLRHTQPRDAAGMVEMQRVFAKARA